MAAARRTKRWNGLVAFIAAVTTARGKRATGWKRGEFGDSTGNRDELTANGGGGSGEKALSVRMLRGEKDVLRGALFNDAAGVHDGDAIGDLGDDTKVVSDEEESEFHFAAELVEQFEDLFLHRDIESGGGLVGDEQFGIGGESHGDHDALAKSAGELMRKLPVTDVGFGNGGAFEGSVDASLQMSAAEVGFVSANGFFDLRANTHDGIERGHRLLKDHGNFAAADGAPVVFCTERG